MLTTLLRSIYDQRYRYIRPKGVKRSSNHFGSGLELMAVSMRLSIWTRDGKPISYTEVARRLHMPASNVKRLLETLIADGSAIRVGKGYCADLDRLDTFASMQRLDAATKLLEDTLEQWAQLRIALKDRLPKK